MALLFAAGVLLYRMRLDYPITDHFRSLAFYLTPVLVCRFGRTWVAQDTELAVRLARFALYTYVGYAALQAAGYDFFGFYDTERIAAGRGANSFFPEPSMFGFCITSLAIFIAASAVGRLDILVYCFGLILCGASSVIIASLPFLAWVVFSGSGRLSGKLAFAGLVGLLGAIFVSVFPNLLPARLVGLIGYSGNVEDFADFSVLERAGHIYYSIFETNWFFGGMQPWGYAYNQFISKHELFRFGSDVNNILSGFGTVIYDGGLIGVGYLVALYLYGRPLFNKNRWALASAFLILIQSMSFAVPIVWLAVFPGWQKRDNHEAKVKGN